MCDSVTHVAGPVVRIQDRILQRCAVCGEKLFDNIRMGAPVGPDGTVPIFLSWKEGELINIRGNHSSAIGQLEAAEIIPKDFCLDLVE